MPQMRLSCADLGELVRFAAMLQIEESGVKHL